MSEKITSFDFVSVDGVSCQFELWPYGLGYVVKEYFQNSAGDSWSDFCVISCSLSVSDAVNGFNDLMEIKRFSRFS